MWRFLNKIWSMLCFLLLFRCCFVDVAVRVNLLSNNFPRRNQTMFYDLYDFLSRWMSRRVTVLEWLYDISSRKSYRTMYCVSYYFLCVRIVNWNFDIDLKFDPSFYISFLGGWFYMVFFQGKSSVRAANAFSKLFRFKYDEFWWHHNIAIVLNANHWRI